MNHHKNPLPEDVTFDDLDGLCIQDTVEVFMLASGQLNERGFGKSSDEARVVRRAMLMGSKGEITEFDNADFANDLVEFVDGALDAITVLWGTLYKTIGPIAAGECAEEVNRSNLDKINGKHGPVVWEGEPYNSKVLKPEGWQPPDIAGILARHGWVIQDGVVVKEGDCI